VIRHDRGMRKSPDAAEDAVLARLSSLRQHHHEGKRSPHKPLLILLALGRLMSEGTSEITWSVAEDKLANLLRDYGRPSTVSRAQSAAYPFTRLRADGIWTLDHEVPMDKVRPLVDNQVSGRLVPTLEEDLGDPDIAAAAARLLVEREFPPSIAPDILMAVGLDPDAILRAFEHDSSTATKRLAGKGSRRVGPAVRFLRFRRPTRRCCRGRRSGARSLVQLRRPRRPRQRARAVRTAPQVVRSRSPRARPGPADPRIVIFLQSHGARKGRVRASPAPVATTPGNQAREGTY
jgi:hypothetical protein